jgi:hypothetical protein
MTLRELAVDWIEKHPKGAIIDLADLQAHFQDEFPEYCDHSRRGTRMHGGGTHSATVCGAAQRGAGVEECWMLFQDHARRNHSRRFTPASVAGSGPTTC